MRAPLIATARRLGVHPRDLTHAINTGHLDAWHMGGDIIVDADQAQALELDRWMWTAVYLWAAGHGHRSVTVRAMIASGELEGVRYGRRRWVLEPVT